jgi:hypothetical protein
MFDKRELDAATLVPQSQFNQSRASRPVNLTQAMVSCNTVCRENAHEAHAPMIQKGHVLSAPQMAWEMIARICRRTGETE